MTARLVPAATEDALALLLDDGVAAARAASPLLTVNRHDASRRRMATEDRRSSLESSIEKPTTDSDAWTGNVDACERETEPRTEGVPRWHLWYRGKVRYRIYRRKRYLGRVTYYCTNHKLQQVGVYHGKASVMLISIFEMRVVLCGDTVTCTLLRPSKHRRSRQRLLAVEETRKDLFSRHDGSKDGRKTIGAWSSLGMNAPEGVCPLLTIS